MSVNTETSIHQDLACQADDCFERDRKWGVQVSRVLLRDSVR